MTSRVKITIVALAILVVLFGVMWYRSSATKTKPAKQAAPAAKPDVFVQLTDLFSTGNNLSDSIL